MAFSSLCSKIHGKQLRRSLLHASSVSANAFILFLITTLPAASASPVQADSQSSDRAAGLVALQELDQRVADIGWKLATQNLELCPTRFAAIGLTLHTASQYDAKWRSAAIQAFGFDARLPGVLAVAQGSPAWAAGIRPNDSILDLNRSSLVPSSAGQPSAKGSYDDTNLAMMQLEAVPIGQPVELLIQRNEQHFSVTLMPAAACASRFEMATSNQLNANSNGKVVQVFGRLVMAFPDDNDLALVMGHELAHNILGHNQFIRSHRLSTGLAASWTGSGKVLRDFERQADRYGIFLTARAGFSYQHAADFWKRLAATGGLGAWIAVTHPTPGDRQQNAQAAVDEIGTLAAQGRPLVPADLKPIAIEPP